MILYTMGLSLTVTVAGLLLSRETGVLMQSVHSQQLLAPDTSLAAALRCNCICSCYMRLALLRSDVWQKVVQHNGPSIDRPKLFSVLRTSIACILCFGLSAYFVSAYATRASPSEGVGRLFHASHHCGSDDICLQKFHSACPAKLCLGS